MSLLVVGTKKTARNKWVSVLSGFPYSGVSQYLRYILVVSRFQAGVPPHHCSCLRSSVGFILTLERYITAYSPSNIFARARLV